jgi:peptide/nickel transport system permease protein
MSVREQPFVEAAIAAGSPDRKVLVKHILPTTITPLVVQAAYIAAAAIIAEAYLSLLRAGHAARNSELGQHRGRGPCVVHRCPVGPCSSRASSSP